MGKWSDLPNWEWRGPTPNQGGGMFEQRGGVVHIAEGSFEGTISWQKNAGAEVSSHFIVAKDGRIAQMVDTSTIAWTQADGNGYWLSIENEGFVPDKLTSAQIEANAQIFAKGHLVYGYPLKVTSSPSVPGLGHHSMGAPSWGHSACPGTNIINQKSAIVARATEIVGGDMGCITEDTGTYKNLTIRAKAAVQMYPTYEVQNGTETNELAAFLRAMDAKLDQVIAGVPVQVVLSDEQLGQLADLLYGKYVAALCQTNGS